MLLSAQQAFSLQLSHHGISIVILLCALTMSQLLCICSICSCKNLVSYPLQLLVLVYCFPAPQVFISVPALPSCNLPSTCTSVINIIIDESLTCKVVLGINWVGLCCMAMMRGLGEFLDSSSVAMGQLGLVPVRSYWLLQFLVI